MLSFDPQANLASTLIFGFFFSTFPKNIFSVDPKMGTSFFSAKSQIISDFFKGPFKQMLRNVRP